MQAAGASVYFPREGLDEARKIVVRLRAITPLVVDDAMVFRNPEQRELYRSGLRLAMGDAS